MTVYNTKIIDLVEISSLSTATASAPATRKRFHPGEPPVGTAPRRSVGSEQRELPLRRSLSHSGPRTAQRSSWRRRTAQPPSVPAIPSPRRRSSACPFGGRLP
jgi:hypothetical protein